MMKSKLKDGHYVDEQGGLYKVTGGDVHEYWPTKDAFLPSKAGGMEPEYGPLSPAKVEEVKAKSRMRHPVLREQRERARQAD